MTSAQHSTNLFIICLISGPSITQSQGASRILTLFAIKFAHSAINQTIRAVSGAAILVVDAEKEITTSLISADVIVFVMSR
jgi:hypothetical protein